MGSACCHLHVHSEYSLLDGAADIDALARRAAELGQPALALTDHGVMNGAVELYEAASRHGIKPLLGCELYFVDDRHARPGAGRRIERNHLTVLAATDDGYRNLMRLSSLGFLEGLHSGRPAVDLDALAAHHDGLIVMSGCLASRISQRLIADDPHAAREHADTLHQIFGDRLYFEVQKNGITDQDKANEGIARIAREVGRPLVAAGDVHYLRRDDYHAHQALLCVQTKSTLAAPKLSFDTNEFYLKDNAEMAAAFAQWPDALPTTLEIAERCQVEIKLGRQLIPRYLPEGEDEHAYLRARVEDGLRGRYGDPPVAQAIERAEYELRVITKMGFDAYFLIVWDVVTWANDHGIAVGPGRGSAAGSIIAYTLGITDVCPLEHGLLFERFLNPERVSMPDIDIDFSVRGRERVMQYVVEKYGRESVAQIITFGRMLPRAATRDAARVLGHPYQKGDELAKLIPDPQQGRPPSFEECLANGQDLRVAYDTDPDTRKIVDLAEQLEGTVRNASSHAAAVVIAGMALTDVVPVQLADAGRDTDGRTVYRQVTAFSMGPVERLGLLKMDFLGLRNLDVIEDALDLIAQSVGQRPDITQIAMTDPATFDMLARGDSVGVFQFESDGMQDALRRVRPTEFADLVALVALYRPGAIDQIPTYARGKRDPSAVYLADERLAPIIGGTYGVILYQEQAMQIAQKLAGFSGARADDLRKAIGKKNRAAMAELKPEFIDGCRFNGVADEVIDWLWQTNERSADYSFNRSHAACYALIAYRTAWLKANHPAQYMAALISSVMDTKDKVPFFVEQAERMGIGILPPDVNASEGGFVVTGGDIRFGLEAVRGVGHHAVQQIMDARRDSGAFSDLWDFCARVALDKGAIGSLIHAGALDGLPGSRRGKAGTLDAAVKAAARSRRDAEVGQALLFAAGQQAEPAADRRIVGAQEYDQRTLLAFERDAIGLYMSSHPLKGLRGVMREHASRLITELADAPDGERVTTVGMLSRIERRMTRKGQPMAHARLEDLDATVELVLFDRVLERCSEAIGDGEVVVVEGRLEHKDGGRRSIVAASVCVLDATAPTSFTAEAERHDEGLARDGQPLMLDVDAQVLHPDVLRNALTVMAEYPGPVPVVLQVDGHRLRLGATAGIEPSGAAADLLSSLLGT